jgi:DNA-directed RNA polymerase subunit H (RpoH/RPB5)
MVVNKDGFMSNNEEVITRIRALVEQYDNEISHYGVNEYTDGRTFIKADGIIVFSVGEGKADKIFDTALGQGEESGLYKRYEISPEQLPIFEALLKAVPKAINSLSYIYNDNGTVRIPIETDLKVFLRKIEVIASPEAASLAAELKSFQAALPEMVKDKSVATLRALAQNGLGRDFVEELADKMNVDIDQVYAGKHAAAVLERRFDSTKALDLSK